MPRGVPKEKLTDTHRYFILDRYAQYWTAQEIADAIKEEFGLEVTRQRVQHYQPGSRDLKPKWVKHFERARAAFTTQVCDVPISHKAVRLRRLEKLFEKASTAGAIVLAQSVLEQAAKEEGGLYTNARSIGVKGTVTVEDAIARAAAEAGVTD